MKRLLVVFAALLGQGGLLGTAFAAPAYNGIYVFGDSLSDGGNAFILNTTNPGLGAALGYLVPTNPLSVPYPVPPSPNGTTKYTNGNGPVAVEVLAANLGLSLTASLAPSGGTNFAVGGATTGTANFASDAFVVSGIPFYPALANTGLQTQVADFQASLGGGPANPNALYVVWAGPNDVFLQGAAFDPLASVGNIGNAIAALYGMGARSFFVPNMPDLGKTPAFLPDPVGGPAATFATQVFNALLAAMLAELEALLPGSHLIPFDTFSLLGAVVADPAAFGFLNATEPCLGIVTCADPGSYVFWDEVHPTARAHAMLGASFTRAVPEPSTWATLAIGLLALAFTARRRASR